MTRIITIELLDSDDFAPLEPKDVMDAIADYMPDILNKMGIPYAGVSIQIGSPDDPRDND